MLDWLASIGDFLVSVIDFIITFFTNAVEVCVIVFKGLAYATNALVFMPAPYGAAMMLLLSFAIIVTIVHFGG